MNSNSNSRILNFLEAHSTCAGRFAGASALWLAAAFCAHVTIASNDYVPMLCTSIAFAIGSILVSLPARKWKTATRYCFFLLMGLDLFVICECLARLRFAFYRAIFS